MLLNKSKIILLVFIIFFISILLFYPKDKNTIIIGVVKPLEHQAMQEIVKGLAENLAQNLHKKYVLKVENAQNDLNLQRAILQKMQDANYDVILPIGTVATQMALSLSTKTAIVGLAANLTAQDLNSLKSCNIAIVHDEIPAQKILQFIKKAYPKLNKLSFIHSSADNVLPQVPKIIAIGQAQGIAIKHFMVSSLPELITQIHALSQDTQGILIIKDHLLASGASLIAQVAADKKIPFIAADEGSVSNGASFALGVHEREIGIAGAKLVIDLLQHKQHCPISIVEMNRLTVFINNKIIPNTSSSLPIENAAHNLFYKTEFIH